MKKLLAIITTVVSFIACSCDPDLCEEYEITYRVHFPDTTITYARPVACESEGAHFELTSSRGTNYIIVWSGDKEMSIKTYVHETTAPMDVISFEKVRDE